MKAISMWEPWASLVRTGAKRLETRSWSTRYRGPLLICAAKGGIPKSELIFLLSCWNFQGGLAPLVGKPLDLTFRSWPGVKIEDLNFGKAVAVVDLVNCKPTGKLTQEEIGTDEPFGDFSMGRFAWQLENVVAIEPFPVKGMQGLFEVDEYSEEINQLLNSYDTARAKELP